MQVGISLLPHTSLSELQMRLSRIQPCFTLVKDDLNASPICSHCNFRPQEENIGISGTTGICSAGGQYQLYVDHGGTCYISDISLMPNTWSLVAVTFDGTNAVFYIDSVASVAVPAQLFSYGVSTYEIGGNGRAKVGPIPDNMAEQAKAAHERLIEAVAKPQSECFAAGLRFARTEGIVPAPEPTHAVAACIEEALRCKETGEEKVILTALCGHGLLDLPAYAEYMSGELKDLQLSDKAIEEALASVPASA